MHARDHHRPRPDRRQRHARGAARHVRACRRRDAVGAWRYRGKARRTGESGAPGWSLPHLSARQGACRRARAGHHRAGQPGGLEGGGDVQRGGAARRGVPPHHLARHGEAMKPILTIAKRELASYFTSPVAYVFLVIFLLLTGFFTFTAGNFFERGEASLAAFFGWHPWLYLVLVPAVGMRLWAEERRSGTLELLLTIPITPWQAIIAKFLASWAFLAVALALTFPTVITANILGDPDNGQILAGYLGSLLLAAAYLAIASMTSAMTRNQVVALFLSVMGFAMFATGIIIPGHRAGWRNTSTWFIPRWAWWRCCPCWWHSTISPLLLRCASTSPTASSTPSPTARARSSSACPPR